MKNTREDWVYILQRIKQEGFNYCFMHYSDWEEIEDFEFHRLRKQYIEYSIALNEYIKRKANEPTD